MKTKNVQTDLPIHDRGNSLRPQLKFKNRKSKIALLWFSRMRQIVDAAPDWPLTQQV